MTSSVNSSPTPRRPFRATVRDKEQQWRLETTLAQAFAGLKTLPVDDKGGFQDPNTWSQELLDAVFLLAEGTQDTDSALERIDEAVDDRLSFDPTGFQFMTAVDVAVALESFRHTCEPSQEPEPSRDQINAETKDILNLSDLDNYLKTMRPPGAYSDKFTCTIERHEKLLAIAKNTDNKEYAARQIRYAMDERLAGEEESEDDGTVPELTFDDVTKTYERMMDPGVNDLAADSNEALLYKTMTELGLKEAAGILPGDLQPVKSLGDPLNWPRGVIMAVHTTLKEGANLQEVQRMLKDKIKARLRPGRGKKVTGRAKHPGTIVSDADAVRDWFRKQQREGKPDATRRGSEAFTLIPETFSPASEGGLEDGDELLVPEDVGEWT